LREITSSTALPSLFYPKPDSSHASGISLRHHKFSGKYPGQSTNTICDQLIASNMNLIKNAPTTSFLVRRIHAPRTASYYIHRNTRHTRQVLGSSLFAARPANKTLATHLSRYQQKTFKLLRQALSLLTLTNRMRTSLPWRVLSYSSTFELKIS
jgi:hypothetical protein